MQFLSAIKNEVVSFAGKEMILTDILINEEANLRKLDLIYFLSFGAPRFDIGT